QDRVARLQLGAVVGDLLDDPLAQADQRVRWPAAFARVARRRDQLRRARAEHQWYVEGERAAFARRAAQLDLAAEQVRQLAADRQAQAGAAVLAARARVGLLERLEHDLLLVERDADPGVADRERDHLAGRLQHGVLGVPAAGRRRDVE